jgi:two-component system OmpR family response regulator
VVTRNDAVRAPGITGQRRAQPTVVVADDDPGIRNLVSQLLHVNGFFVVTCGDGFSAVQLSQDLKPALVILDIRMPNMDGFAACETLRRSSDVPVIFLTVVDAESDAVRAFEAGADDYIRKPFGARELVSRVRAVTRRFRSLPGEKLVLGTLEVDENQRLAFVNGSETRLSATEFALLSYLIRNANKVVTHAQILDQVWGFDYLETRQVIRLVVHRLRRKLGVGLDVRLETIAGVGYRLSGPTH